MERINLTTLAKKPVESVNELRRLAMLSDAPLRIEHEDGKIYLRVRSWPTYFFEKIVAWDSEIAEAETDTQQAIEKYARSFLSNSKTTLDAAEGDLITSLLHTRTLNKMITRPVFASAAKTGAANKSRIADNEPAFKEVSRIASNGAMLVPKGVSIAQINAVEKRAVAKGKGQHRDAPIRSAATNSAFKVLADVRILRKDTIKLATRARLLRAHTVDLENSSYKTDNLGTRQSYETYYRTQLNSVARSISTSVLLELRHDTNAGCSADNVNGALDAANGFIEAQLKSGKHVSVMIAVPELPKIDPLPKYPGIATGAKENRDEVIEIRLKPEDTSKSDSDSE